MFDEWNGIHKPGIGERKMIKYIIIPGNDRYYGEKLIDETGIISIQKKKEEKWQPDGANITGHTYYYNKYGAMQYGWNNINGTEYYFCKVTNIY